MKPAILLLTISALAVFGACSQSSEDQATVRENGSATLTLQVTGMT